MWKSPFTGKWIFIYCPKTESMDNFCPICAIVSKLYNSTSATDKALGRSLRRGVKYVSNAFIVADPIDEKRDDKDKVVNTNKLFEFGKKIEGIVDTQLNDDDGIGILAFDPEDGKDFIIRVGKTPKDAEGNDYWNYDKTSFANNPKPLGSEKEIKKIMEATFNIDEYIGSIKNEKSMEEIIKVLDGERLSGWIDDELVQLGLKTKSAFNGNSTTQPTDKEETGTATSSDSGPVDDEELLRQLEDL